MKYIEALEFTEICMSEISVFLAGGITGTKDWQKDLIKKIDYLDITIINPRRKKFDLQDKKQSTIQIPWEFEYLRFADFIVFYFCKETVCPIALFELGVHSTFNKPLIVGMDKDYSRRIDVEIQMKLARPEIEIVYSLNDVAKQVDYWHRFLSEKTKMFSVKPMETIGMYD
jgi:hypothetical protein